MRRLWTGLDVPEPCSPAFAMWGDGLSSAGVLVASRCPLSIHPFPLLSFILSLTNFYLNSVFLRCGTRYPRPRIRPHTRRPFSLPFGLYVVNIVRLPSLPAPPSTCHSSPSNSSSALPFLPFLFLPLSAGDADQLSPAQCLAPSVSRPYRRAR